MNIYVKEGYELKAFIAPKKGNYYYAIIYRAKSPCEPYVFCSGYDISDGTWGAGHYFETYQEAFNYMVEYLRY